MENTMQIGISEDFPEDVTESLKTATQFYMDLLLPKYLQQGIYIDVELSPEINAQGLAYPDDLDEEDDEPYSFTVDLRCHADDDDIFQTLAHELVHIKQYIKGELRTAEPLVAIGSKQKDHNTEKEDTYWYGKLWTPAPNEDGYFAAPWEIEAFGREVGLYARWLDHYEEKTRTKNNSDIMPCL